MELMDPEVWAPDLQNPSDNIRGPQNDTSYITSVEHIIREHTGFGPDFAVFRKACCTAAHGGHGVIAAHRTVVRDRPHAALTPLQTHF